MSEISANKRWKQSGTTLSFKDWLKREDQKKESLQSDINFIGFTSTEAKPDQILEPEVEVLNASGDTPTVDPNSTLGINNGYLLLAGIIILGSIMFVVYKNSKKGK